MARTAIRYADFATHGMADNNELSSIKDWLELMLHRHRQSPMAGWHDALEVADCADFDDDYA